jgi:hypothetical protein
MKTPSNPARVGVFVLCCCMVFSLHLGAAEFVKLAAEIQTASWIHHGTNAASTVEIKTCTIQCVVGTNTWLIKGDFQPTKHAWWFTRSNIIAHTLLVDYPSERKEFFHQNHPNMVIGKTYARVFDSPDGRPVPSPALAAGTAFNEALVRIPWLALCSGPYLKRGDKKIPLPHIDEFNFALDYSAKTTVFEDDLGLPRTVDFCMPNAQPVFQYRVLESTNVLGWTFPVQFHLAQYRQARPTGGWELDFTATGKIISIGPGSHPQLPSETTSAVGRPRSRFRQQYRRLGEGQEIPDLVVVEGKGLSKSVRLGCLSIEYNKHCAKYTSK